MQVHIRWMIRRDLPQVLEAERTAFPGPWDEEDFLSALRRISVIGMVAEHQERVIGHMVYELFKHRLYLRNLAVHADFQGHGVGRQMIEKLVGKLAPDRRNRIVADVRETNLDAHLFFKAMGFEVVEIMRRFEPTGEDAYRFVRRISIPAALTT